MATKATSIKLPPSILSALDTEALRLGMDRTAVIKDLLLGGLRERGLWPPPVRRTPP